MMRVGRAQGGPLDGVKISSGELWSGVIRGSLDGYYRWNVVRGMWMWTLSVKPRASHSKKEKETDV
jgi:hypothetical protein